MTIITDFPFTHCESCPECVLRAETKSVTYAPYNNVTTRVVKVSCENASLCMRLEKMKDERKAKVESDDGN